MSLNSGRTRPYNRGARFTTVLFDSMSPQETLILATYFFVLVILAVYGWHRYYLVYLYMKTKDAHPVPSPPLAAFSRVSKGGRRAEKAHA